MAGIRSVLSRLLRTSALQIAALYLALLSLTLLALLAIVYWSTAELIDRQMTDTIEAEIRGLAEQYRDEGLPRLIEVVGERSGPNGDPQSIYVLTNSALEPLAGNLAVWPGNQSGADGWFEVRLQRGSDKSASPHVVRGRAFDLAGGYRLFVGRDTVERSDFKKIMVEAFIWALINRMTAMATPIPTAIIKS